MCLSATTVRLCLFGDGLNIFQTPKQSPEQTRKKGLTAGKHGTHKTCTTPPGLLGARDIDHRLGCNATFGFSWHSIPPIRRLFSRIMAFSERLPGRVFVRWDANQNRNKRVTCAHFSRDWNDHISTFYPKAELLLASALGLRVKELDHGPAHSASPQARQNHPPACNFFSSFS